MTLRLQNVPWDQALDIVLRTKGLDMRREGNVIIVAPAEEIAAREKAELEARKTSRSWRRCAPSTCRSTTRRRPSSPPDQVGGASSLLSERGSVAIDERTNTLLLQDTAERLADIRRLVATLDIPVRQVLIEARIVIVNDDFSRELGVRFGARRVDHGGKDGAASSVAAASCDEDRRPRRSTTWPA